MYTMRKFADPAGYMRHVFGFQGVDVGSCSSWAYQGGFG